MQNLEMAAVAILQIQIEVLVVRLATVQWTGSACIDLFFVC